MKRATGSRRATARTTRGWHRSRPSTTRRTSSGSTRTSSLCRVEPAQAARAAHGRHRLGDAPEALEADAGVAGALALWARAETRRGGSGGGKVRARARGCPGSRCAAERGPPTRADRRRPRSLVDSIDDVTLENMPGRSALFRVVATVVPLCALTGCPQLLSDEFSLHLDDDNPPVGGGGSDAGAGGSTSG